MKKNASSVPFKGTPEQKAKLDAVIEAKKNIEGSLMQVMQEAHSLPCRPRVSTKYRYVSVPRATSKARRSCLTGSPRFSALSPATARRTESSRLRHVAV